MRTPLVFALAFSLLVNVGLAILVLRQPAVSTSPSAVSLVTNAPNEKSVRGTASSATAKGDGGAAAMPALSARDPKGVIDTLRGAGLSPAMLRSIANQLAREHIAQDPSEIAPYWKRESFDPANRQARLALERRREEFVEQLLGDDARLSAQLNAGQKQRQYGSLSDEKIDAIARIDRDYAEVRQAAQASQAGRSGGIDRVQDMMRQQEVFEQEKRADLAAILTPEELEQYDMRNSRTAASVMNAARSIDLTESEYTALYRAQKAFDDANPRQVGSIDPEMLEQRNIAQDAVRDQARAILGDERFFRYLESSDPNYGAMARFANQEKLPPSTAYEVYKIQREMQSSLAQVARSQIGNVSRAQRTAGALAVAAEFEARLQQLLSPSALEAYKKQGMGRMLNSLNSRAPQGAMPAVQLPGG